MSILSSARVWTRFTGEPRPLGTLVKSGDDTTFLYDPHTSDLPGIGLVYDTARFKDMSIPWKGDYDEPLHPIFMALVPPCSLANLQYAIAAKRLGFKRDTQDKEWKLLRAFGHGAIGHLDVFESDVVAEAWYAGPSSAPVTLATSPLASLALAAVERTGDPIPLDQILNYVGNAPSPGGAMPKVLHPVVWPETGEVVDALVKFERTSGGNNRHPEILILERWGYEVHERMGLSVPRCALLLDQEGNQVLATERFDRAKGVPVPCESLYSVLKSIAPDVFESPFTPDYATKPNWEMIAKVFRNPEVAVTCDPDGDSLSMYARTVLSFLTANGDLHLKNTSFLGFRGQARLSPVYDPAPMRLYGGLSTPTAVTFGKMQFYGQELPSGFGDAVVGLGKAFGLSAPTVERTIRNALAVTENATDRMAVLGVSPRMIERFNKLVGPVRVEIVAAFDRRYPARSDVEPSPTPTF